MLSHDTIQSLFAKLVHKLTIHQHRDHHPNDSIQEQDLPISDALDPSLVKISTCYFQKMCSVQFQEMQKRAAQLQPFRRYSRKTEGVDENTPTPATKRASVFVPQLTLTIKNQKRLLQFIYYYTHPSGWGISCYRFRVETVLYILRRLEKQEDTTTTIEIPTRAIYMYLICNFTATDVQSFDLRSSTLGFSSFAWIGQMGELLTPNACRLPTNRRHQFLCNLCKLSRLEHQSLPTIRCQYTLTPQNLQRRALLGAPAATRAVAAAARPCDRYRHSAALQRCSGAATCHFF